VRQHASTPSKPGYFRFLTLLAFHTFLTLKVDATVLEVGVGGTYDSTNIVPRPIVTGVTALGIDHVGVLGGTLKEIAWHKGGIFKEGVPALTVEQPEEGMHTLWQRAWDLKASELLVVPTRSDIAKIELGLAGAHQIQNASLAVELAKVFLRSQGECDEEATLPVAFVGGLMQTRWPGRCQSVVDPALSNTTWFLDGAHTVESLVCGLKWFVSPSVALRPQSSRVTRVLVFNCTSGRSGTSFLGKMQAGISDLLRDHNDATPAASFFDHVIFCTNVTHADGGFKGDLKVSNDPTDLAHSKTQETLASAWSALIPTFPNSNIHILPSVEHAVNLIRKLDHSKSIGPVDVLVTGSLHLVGGVIEVAGLAGVAL